jgi:hypothetical protein
VTIIPPRGLPDFLTLLQVDGNLCSEARADVAELSRLKCESDFKLIYTATTASRVPIAGLILGVSSLCRSPREET